MAASFFSFCNRSGPGPPIQGTWLKTLQVRELGSSAQTPTTFDFARQRANPKHTYVCVVTTYESHTIDNQTHLKVVDRTSSEHFYSADPSQSSPLKNCQLRNIDRAFSFSFLKIKGSFWQNNDLCSPENQNLEKSVGMRRHSLFWGQHQTRQLLVAPSRALPWRWSHPVWNSEDDIDD